MRLLICFAVSLLSLALSDATVITFSRVLNTCDAQDFVLARGTVRVIYAYSRDDVASRPSYHHGNRGAKSLQLLNVPKPDAQLLPDDLEETTALMNNVTISSGVQYGFDARTTYWCRGFQIGDRSRPKRHIIRADPVITPTSLGKAHHMILYECMGNLTDADLAYSGSCYGRNLPRGIGQCRGVKPLALWAIGGSGFAWPEEAGFPLGGADGAVYGVLEMHYDNVDGRPFVDSSGVKLYHTAHLRQFDAGVFFTGYMVTKNMKIPPGQAEYDIIAHCPSGCSQHFPGDGLQVFASLLHMHTAGRRIDSRLIRNGTVVENFAEPYYDFAMQETMVLQRPFVNYRPGDTLLTRCTYDTRGRTKNTVGGLSSEQEMCMNFLLYYPRLPSDQGACFMTYANFTDQEMIERPPNEGANPVAWCASSGVYPADPNERYVDLPPPVCSPQPVELRGDSLDGTTTTTVQRHATSEFDPSVYEHSAFLDPQGQNFKLHWTIDSQNQIAHFAAETPDDNSSPGWIGLGFSGNGGMRGADIVMGWINSTSNATMITDRFSSDVGLPSQDPHQDIFNLHIYSDYEFHNPPPAPPTSNNNNYLVLDKKMKARWWRETGIGSHNPVHFEVVFQGDEWFAVGFSEDGEMSPSDAFIFKPSEQTIEQYEISGHSQTGIVKSLQSSVQNMEVVSGSTGSPIIPHSHHHHHYHQRATAVPSTAETEERILTFVVNPDSPTAPRYFPKGSSTTSTVNMIFAYGSSDEFGVHAQQGNAYIDLNSNFARVSTEGADSFVLLLHGSFAFVSMCMAMPMGIMYRYLIPDAAKAHKLHMTAQLAAAFIAAVSMGAAIVGVDNMNPEEHFTKLHHFIGIFVFALIGLQVIGGFLRPHKSEHDRDAAPASRRLFEVVHTISGRLIVFLASINAIIAVISFEYLNLPKATVVVLGFLCVVMWGTLIFLRIRKFRQAGASRGKFVQQKLEEDDDNEEAGNGDL